MFVVEHYEILKRRQVGLPTSDDDATFSNFANAPLITTRNSVRTAVNTTKTQSTATHQNEQVIVVTSRDQISADVSAEIRPTMKKKLWHELDNKTEDLIGMLPCVSKMPLVIKANLATELGICNGTLCTLSRVICHPDERNMHDLDTKQP